MIRIELIANQSVQDVLINNLESLIPDFYYTLIPLVYGRGKESYKLGTTTWPETNILLLAYTDDSNEETVQTIISYVKSKHKDEGIKLFIMHDGISKKPF